MTVWADTSSPQLRIRPTKQTPTPSSTHQKVIVLSGPHGPSNQVKSICEALEIDIIAAESHYDLPFSLHHSNPIAVIFEIAPETLASCAALRMIAAFGQDLPVLLTTGADPVVLGTIDAAQELWQLSGLHRLSAIPGPAELIQFLYQAGRKSGGGRLMPLA